MSADAGPSPEPTAATAPGGTRVAAGLAGVLAVGCALMAVAHTGVAVPVLSAFGPEGGRAVAPAAAAFGAAAGLWTAVAVGTARRRAWAWALGLVVGGLTVLAAALPFRGVGSAVGILLGAGVITVLLSRPGRRELLGR